MYIKSNLGEEQKFQSSIKKRAPPLYVGRRMQKIHIK